MKRDPLAIFLKNSFFGGRSDIELRPGDSLLKKIRCLMKETMLWLSALTVLCCSACSEDNAGENKDGSEQGTQSETIDSSSEGLMSCEGKLDFTPCEVTTVPDRDYDICVKGKCVSPGCGDATCNPRMPHFKMPHVEGHESFEFIDGPEPIVLDKATGLHWIPCFAGEGGVACKRDLVEAKAWDKAVAHCDALDWGGFSDWHLPDSYELVSMLDYSFDANDRIPEVFDVTGSIMASWTISTNACRESLAWSVGFDKAERVLTMGRKELKLPFLCTRGEGGAKKQRKRKLLEAEEPVVIDELAGKIWIGCSFGLFGENCEKGEIWLEDRVGPALYQHCDELNWSNMGGWRLPSVKEMISVMDYRACEPSVNIDEFPNHEMSYYWTSSPQPEEAGGWVWYITTYNGGVGWEGAMFSALMCVAGI